VREKKTMNRSMKRVREEEVMNSIGDGSEGGGGDE
jgi:hypothetical protein